MRNVKVGEVRSLLQLRLTKIPECTRYVSIHSRPFPLTLCQFKTKTSIRLSSWGISSSRRRLNESWSQIACVCHSQVMLYTLVRAWVMLYTLHSGQIMTWYIPPLDLLYAHFYISYISGDGVRGSLFKDVVSVKVISKNKHACYTLNCGVHPQNCPRTSVSIAHTTPQVPPQLLIPPHIES